MKRQSEVEVVMPMPQKNGFDIEQLVLSATWKELLINLVETNKLDPWDIDISKVVENYIGVVKKMKLMDLSVPANIIFAASVLLRLKSNVMPLFGGIGEESEEDAVPFERVIPEVPELIPRSRHAPRRRVTLNELMEALEEALKIEGKREEYFRTIETPLPFVIDANDMEEKMKSAYDMVLDNADKYRMVSFDALSKMMDTSSTLSNLFVPLLFLAQEGKVLLIQEVFFGDILIKLGKKE